MLKDLIWLVVIFCHGSTCRVLQVLLLPCYVQLIALLLLARCSIDMMVAGRGVVPVVESCSAAESLRIEAGRQTVPRTAHLLRVPEFII